MSDSEPEKPQDRQDFLPGHGVVVVAKNGDVIRYDPTGLVMRLSDKVIADIALRLGTRPEPETPAARTPAAPEAAPTAPPTPVSVPLLEDIDAWNSRIQGDWVYFSANLPGKQGVRGYRKPLSGGAVIADTTGPLYGILAIGGPRSALANRRRSDFPQHVLAPADDIGAVGHAGIARAARTGALEQLREQTHEALIAEILLAWQLEKYEALPLFLTRVESDSSASAMALAQGEAFANLVIAAENLALAASSLDKRARVLAVCLDFALEDLGGSASQYRDGIFQLMERITAEFARIGFGPPLFLSRFETGTGAIIAPAIAEGQAELGWNHGKHHFTHSAPSYMFAHDDAGRPSDAARREMAEMSAHAIAHSQRPAPPGGVAEEWRCPTFHLAEISTRDPRVVRVIAQAMRVLEIDQADPFGAGPTAGFRLPDGGPALISVARDPSDQRTLLLTFEHPVSPDTRLAYALPDGMTAASGAGRIRDDWSTVSASGHLLHRWALPSLLTIRQGGGNA